MIRINGKLEGITILKSCEIDILNDGRLDLSDGMMSQLDIRIAAIHYKFNLPRDKQTERIIRAMDNPYFNIFAHPTGRLINQRPPYEIDIEGIVDAAKERGCFLEINASPSRLDLNDIHCRLAKQRGVKLAVSTDAHATTQLQQIRYGIDQARRGWLEKGDILNTRAWSRLKHLLKR